MKLLLILLFVPSIVLSQSIEGLKLNMSMAQIKKVLPTFYYKLYEPDGKSENDWKLSEQNNSILELYKNQNSTLPTFSILLQNNKSTVIYCYDKDLKFSTIGIGNTLKDFKQKFPDTYIHLVGDLLIVTTPKLPYISFNIDKTNKITSIDLSN